MITIYACQTTDQPKTKIRRTVDENVLVEINKELLKKDNELIDAYLLRRGWKMNITQTGLRYKVYEQGDGRKSTNNLRFEYGYHIELLDGTFCYSSDSLGTKSFIVGKGGVEPGLEEAALFLKEGDRCRLIMLPHLAHHLLGDDDKIPARAIVVYDIHVTAVTDP